MNEEKNSLDEILQSHNNESEIENDVNVLDLMISLFKETDDIVYDITNAVTNAKKEGMEQIGKEDFKEGTTALIEAIMNHVSFMLQSCQKLGLVIREETGNDDTDD